MAMKGYRFLLLLGLALFLVVACRSEETQAPTPGPLATVTLAPERGGEVSEEDDSPDVVPAPPIETSETGERTGVVYSVPFEVRPDGFSFRNYGAGYPEGAFTIADLRTIFGDGVCSRIESDGDICIPTAEAQQWIDDRNADMRAGHCIGFTVTSYRFAEGELEAGTFNPAASKPFDIERKVPIMRTIAVNGSLYWADSVWSSEVSGTPREIIDALIALGEPVDLSIFLPGLVGGHSLLAYGVDEVAPQQYRILVYDNNYPGQEAFVEVDYAANTWRYDQGAVNPDQPAVPYEGDASTETLRFIPLSAYDSVACPFCSLPSQSGESQEEIEAFTLLSFLGQGDVLVETALGKIGWVAGEIINEIPGARFIFQRGQLGANDTPDIILPAGLDFSARFNGMQRVSSLGPDASLVLNQLTPSPDENTLSVAPTNRSVAYQAGGEQTPILQSTIRGDGSTYKVALLGLMLTDGQSLAMSANEQKGGLVISSPDATITDTTLLITRLTEEDEAIFATTALEIEEGGGVALDVATWDGSGSMDVYTDADGDGSFDEEPTELTNEPLSDVIQQGNTAQIANIFDQVRPYVGAQDLETLLAGLSEKDLSGREIGKILQPLHLTDDQLVSLINIYELPLPELAELLFALRLEPEHLDAVIEGLNLEEEGVDTLRELLAELSLFHDIITEWNFLNSDDMARLAVLLIDRGLTVDQLARLLPRMSLSTEELQQLLPALDLSPEELAELAELLGIELGDGALLTPTAVTTRTATATASPTMTATPTATPLVTPTSTLVGTPAATATPDPYAPPLPTGTPARYPYPEPYPGPVQTPTPQFQSVAFCTGNDLRVVAQEPTWRGANLELRDGETVLATAQMGADVASVEFTIPGPATWSDLVLVSSLEPARVPLGTVTCP